MLIYQIWPGMNRYGLFLGLIFFIFKLEEIVKLLIALSVEPVL